MGESLGIGFQIMSIFAGDGVEQRVKEILGIPANLRIAYAVRLGHPLARSTGYLRVRRDQRTLLHHNRYGTT
jgi:hypothetical protein